MALRTARALPVLVLLLLAGVPEVHAQELTEELQKVAAEYAQPYLEPFANGLGADLNAGLFHTARIGGGLIPGLDLFIGVRAMGALVTSSDKTFNLTYETERVVRAGDGERYTVPVTFVINDGPTVFGDENPGTATATVQRSVSNGPDGVEGTPDDVVIDTTIAFNVLPGLIDTPIAPLLVPHVRIGSFAGTDVVIRYLPRIGNDQVGRIGLMGLGVRHSISQYIPVFPLDVTGQFMWQKLSLVDDADDELFAASAWAANVAVSKTLFMLTVYAGAQVEGSSVEVDYTYFPEDPELDAQTIAFDIQGDNTFRLLGGISFGLGPIIVNADAAVGNRSVISAGVGLFF